MELLVVAVVWVFYGLLHVATDALESHRDGPPLDALADVDLRVFINPFVWAILTTLILWMSRRVSLDRAFWRRRGVLVVIGAVLLANLVDLVSDAVWDALAPANALWGGHDRDGGLRFNPGLGNLTWLDDLAVILAALAVASVRGYVLRERARRDEAHHRAALLEAESARARAGAAQLEAQLAEARLDALRQQLDPHFLFNTLNAVSALVERDPRGVRRMISQLSDLLRHSIDGASVPEVSLREELELLERYVDIMRVRFEDELTVETRADPRTLDALVPNMILQPLVENAIKHGVEQSDHGGRVEVETALEGDTVVLRVSDDGPGMAPWSASTDGASQPAEQRERGVGLRNTAARLAQLYGAAHRFTVGPGRAGGTVSEIRLPYSTRGAARSDSGGLEARRGSSDEVTRAR